MTILETQDQSRDTAHVPGVMFRCHVCRQVKPVKTEGGTGYGRDASGFLKCYDCCAIHDRAEMVRTGKATLYLTCEPKHFEKRPEGRRRAGEVSNWPGTLRFPCHTSTGSHNIARTRYDVRFAGPDGYWWVGVTYGENTQICHCRRTKREVERPRDPGADELAQLVRAL